MNQQDQKKIVLALKCPVTAQCPMFRVLSLIITFQGNHLKVSTSLFKIVDGF